MMSVQSIDHKSEQQTRGFVEGWPLVALRLEGLGALIIATAAYRATGASWLIYAVLFFTPDLSMIGYLANPRIGAAAYNIVHTYASPIAVGAIAFAFGQPALISASLIWAAHIGFDRALGFGLKYPTAFADTHLGALGAFGQPNR